MSSSVVGALHTAATSPGSLKKNFNNNIIDFDLPDNINSTVCHNHVIKRYNRSKLVAIRQGIQSRCCPNSIIKADLKFLGIWKINNSGNLNQNGTRSSNESFNLPGAFDHAVHIQPARPNTRRYRSPSKQEHRLSYGSNSSQQNLLEHSISKAFIDHRSISSSHLMPAFAKKKMAASTMNAGMSHTKASLNSTGIELNSLGSSRSETPTDCKNGIWYSGVSVSSNASLRHRVKSIVPNGFETLGEYGNERDQNQELYGQPAITSGSRHNRIGSGRLIPHQANWESHTIPDNEKSPNSKISSITYDEALPTKHFGPHEKSMCIDRRLDHKVCSEYMSQRTFDRSGLSGEEISNDFYVRSKNTKSSKACITRVTKEDIPKLEPSSVFHRSTRNYMYNDRTEEPEWFSGGPTSQNDTIELRGFEEVDELYTIVEPTGHISQTSMLTQTRSPSPRRNIALISNNSKSTEVTHTSKDQGKESNRCSNISPNDVPTGRNVVNPECSNSVVVEETNMEAESSHIHQPPIVELSNILSENSTKEDESNLGIKNNEQNLNFDVFLNPNLDPLKHSLMRGDNFIRNQDIVLGSSRFSRWFGSKPTDNEILLSKSSGSGNSTNTDVSEKSFSKRETNTLLEFLNKLPILPDLKPINKATNITSVEDIEASMRALDTGKKDAFETFIDISSTPTEKEVKSIDIRIPNAPEQACGTPEEGEVQAFKKLLQKLGSGNMQDRQQKTIFHKVLPATNMQIDVSNTPKCATGPFKLLNITESATTSGRSHIPQYMVIENDEGKNFTQLQFNPQHQNNGNVPYVPISQPAPHHLSVYLASQTENHLETNNLYKCVPRGELPIHLSEEENKDSYVSQCGKEMPDVERCTSFISQLSLTSSVDGPERPGSPLMCRNSDLSLANSVSSSASFPHHGFGQTPSSNTELREACPPPSAHFLPQTRQIILGQRELQLHTQTVMQNTIWKNKVEDHNIQQKDINRKRQETQRQQQPNKLFTGVVVDEMHHKTNSPVQITNSVHRQLQQQTNIHLNIPRQISPINSSTPLAFTPTSVLRKMTADRDSFNASSIDKYQSVATVGMQQKIKSLQETSFGKSLSVQQQMSQLTSQPRMILGGKLSQLQQDCSNTKPSSGLSQSRHQSVPSLRNTAARAKWSSSLQNYNMSTTKPIGRPILKGPSPSQSTKVQRQSQDQISECMLSKLGFQQIQQQGLKSQRQPPSFPQSSTTSQSIPINSILMTQAQQQQVYQERALAMQRLQHQFHLQQQLNNQHQKHEQPIDIFNHNIRMISPMSSDAPPSDSLAEAAAESARIHYQQEGELSPTSNQLAQWFSPELLAQATAGKLPLLNMNQALSLEEFERNMQHSSTRVHN